MNGKGDKEEKIIEKLRSKYEERLKKQLLGEEEKTDKQEKKESVVYSAAYEEFRKEYLPGHLSLYERACQIAERLLRANVSEKRRKKLLELIRITHLNATPEGITSLALIAPFLVLGLIFLVTYLIPALLLGEASIFFLLAGMILSLLSYYLLEKLPDIFATTWKMRASNQLVLAVFYLATYLRHTPNLEKAVQFAAEHLLPPLGLDFKRLLWEVESQKYSSLKEAIDNYLQLWKNDAPEFVEAIHLLEASVYEAAEERRLNALDKSLDLMLEETYEKMLHYSHSLKGPITMIHMLGIVLPILSLVILPLVVSFMQEVKWYHLAFIYNILLPICVYLLTRQILSRRPSGYGGKSIEEIAPFLKQSKKKKVKLFGATRYLSAGTIAILIFIPFFLIGISPLIIHTISPEFDIRFMGVEETPEKVIGGLSFLGYQRECIEGYEGTICTYKGPFGIGATILGIALIAGIGIALSVYYNILSREALKVREKVKRLEQEFAGALFQLANRLGDGLPIEIAIKKVAETMKGTPTGRFFNAAYNNITKLGYDIERAIFDEHVGAIKVFPSPLVEASMKVLVDSIKKGPIVASRALINISTYVRDINRLEERLKDLMADELSSMKTQVGFLAPVISGIVIRITSMITTILVNLQERMGMLQQLGEGMQQFQGFSSLLGMFRLGIPTYYFQIIVGLYLLQVVYLLVGLINGIENGEDILAKRGMLSKYMTSTTILYSVIAIIVILIFNFLAATITTTGI